MRLRLASSLLVLTGLSACTVGPNYTPPKAETPAAWVAKQPKTGQVDSKVTSDSAETVGWWNAFNDAELTSLINRAHDANPDLQQAALRIDEARAQLRQVDAHNLPTVAEDSSYARTRLSPNGALDVFGGGGGVTAQQAAAAGIPSSSVPSSFSNIPPFDLFQTGFGRVLGNRSVRPYPPARSNRPRPRKSVSRSSATTSWSRSMPRSRAVISPYAVCSG